VRPPRKGSGRASSDLDTIEWHTIQPLLPRSRGIKRVDDRRVLNGILWRLRTGRSWAAIPGDYAPPSTCHARFIRWRDAGVWSRIIHAVAEVHSGEVELISAESAGVPPSYERKPILAQDVVAWRRRG
jgi:transposase